jgi:hypothetical protein
MDYRSQLRISADDPLCTASGIEGTIIGILFEKKGSEVQQAIDARVKSIIQKVLEYRGIATKIEEFIEKKRQILREMDLFYVERHDEKETLLKPFQRQIDEIVKKCGDVVFDFNKVTTQKLGGHAVSFEEGFDAFKPCFDELDEFMKKEESIVQGIVGASACYTMNSFQGTTGIQGLCGTTDPCGVSGSIGLGTSSPDAILDIEDTLDSTKEDAAIARIGTLRSLLQKYVKKLDTLKQTIKNLEEESRRLGLIRRNIEPLRIYKLDLNKLSAFGFEDLEIIN